MSCLGKYGERDLPDYSSRDFKERGFTVGIGGYDWPASFTVFSSTHFKIAHYIRKQGLWGRVKRLWHWLSVVVCGPTITSQWLRTTFSHVKIKNSFSGTRHFQLRGLGLSKPVAVLMPRFERIFPPIWGVWKSWLLSSDAKWVGYKEICSIGDKNANTMKLLFVESGGDNLAANYSRELADYIIYVIDVGKYYIACSGSRSLKLS